MIYRNCCQWFKKYDFEINAALDTLKFNKRRIDYNGVLKKVYRLLATQFKDHRFHLTDIKFRDIFVCRIAIRNISKIYSGLRVIQTPPPNRASKMTGAVTI